MQHPEVAFRPCGHCRQFQYDEKDGTPVESRDGKGYMPRLGKVPCEAAIGCKKGTWWAPTYRALTPAEESMVTLYYSSKATGGACLNVDEMSNDVLALLFGHLERLVQAKNSNGIASAVTSGIMAIKGL